MTPAQVATAFAHDALLQAVLVIIALDILLGVAASVKKGAFRLSWLAGFAKDDLLGKVFPWFLIYAVSKYAPSVAVLGIDLSAIEKLVWAAVVAALAGSMLSSLKDLGLPIPDIGALPNLLGGESDEPPASP
jgi:hypothetical protein